MALMTYKILLAGKATDGSIKNWLNRGVVPSLTILRMSEQWIYQRLRIRQMRRKSTNTIIASAALSVAYEDSMLAVERMSLVSPTSYKLASREFDELEDEHWHRDANGDIPAGQPTEYALSDQIYFDRPADQAYTYELWGIFALAPLTESNPTNYLTNNLLPVLMNACAGQAAIYDKQWEASKIYLALAHGEITRVNATHALIQRGVHSNVDVP